MAGAPILIAGKAMDMPDQVKSAIKNVMQTEGTLDAEQSEQFLSLLEDQGRLQQETWWGIIPKSTEGIRDYGLDKTDDVVSNQ